MPSTSPSVMNLMDTLGETEARPKPLDWHLSVKEPALALHSPRASLRGRTDAHKSAQDLPSPGLFCRWMAHLPSNGTGFLCALFKLASCRAGHGLSSVSRRHYDGQNIQFGHRFRTLVAIPNT